VCPVCGAQNNGGHSHCWQCSSLLLHNRPPGHMTPLNADHSQRRESAIRRKSRSLLPAMAMALLLGAVGAGAYQIMLALYTRPPMPGSVADFLQHHMTVTRIVVGVALISLSPPLLNLALRTLGIAPQCTRGHVFLAALAPPALAFLLCWYPPPLLILAIVAPALLAAGLFRRSLGLSWAQAAAVWTGHGIALGLLGFGCLWALESLQAERPLNPIAEIAGLRASAADAGGATRELSGNAGTISPGFRWPSTGSAWLDWRANRAQIELRNARRNGGEIADQPIEIINTETGGVVARGLERSQGWRSPAFRPAPDVIYRAQIDGGFADGEVVVLHSLLPATISP